MGNFMRVILYITAFILVSHLANGQSGKIDSLIKQLKNTELKLDGTYIGPMYFLSDGPATELIKIGKPAVKPLMKVLRDKTKGVIAHYVLTFIFHDTVTGVTPITIAREGITVFTLNELTFFIKGEDVFANDYDLEMNEFKWQHYLDKQK
jgi:hypothetical protein